MKKEKILVTGVNGLIGRELLEQVADDFEIYALVRKMPVAQLPSVNYIIVDFALEWKTDVIPQGIECIVHLSQSEKFREFPASALEVFNVNSYSTVKLLDYAQKNGVKKFIYASSGGIYGNNEQGFKEDFEISINNDLGHYLTTKLVSELLVETYSSFFDVVLLRFFFVYGKNQKRTMLIPRLVDNIKAGKEIMIHGEEGIRINPIHVKDAAKAVISSIVRKTSGKYNIGGCEIFSIKEISETIGKKIGVVPKYIKNSALPKNLIGDIEKMEKELHQPSVLFADGIDELI